jgi:hypothetical protein
VFLMATAVVLRGCTSMPATSVDAPHELSAGLVSNTATEPALDRASR